MGYEVKFLYYEKDPNTGNYNKEEEKSLVKKVGKSTEEVPLEKLAFIIMNQMARRDIWVEDVEIYEFIKKKITFKESTSGDGILIGGKKFGSNNKFENVSDDSEESIIENNPTQVPQPHPQPPITPAVSAQDQMLLDMQRQMMDMQKQLLAAQQQGQRVQSNQSGGGGLNLQEAHHRAMMEDQKKRQEAAMNKDPKIHPIRYEFFKPDPGLIPHIREKGLKFTVDNKYPIYDERMGDNGFVYVTQDDQGNRIMLHSIYFVPNIRPLDGTGSGLLQTDESYNHNNRPKLTYDNSGYSPVTEVYNDPDSGRSFDMPDIRRDIRRVRG